MSYVFEKYSAGGSGGTDSGFIVITLSGTSGTLPIPEGMTAEELLANPARVVFNVSDQILTYKEAGYRDDGVMYGLYESVLDMSVVNNGRIVTTVKVYLDLTYEMSSTTESGSGGTDNGFIVIPFGNEAEGEPLTLPDGLTFEDLASNPARFVLKPVAGGQVLTFQQVIMLNQSGSQLAYAYEGYMDYTPAGVGTGLVKAIITIQPDLTYSLSGGPVTDNGFVVLEADIDMTITEGNDFTGTIIIPENFDMTSVEMMHNVLVKFQSLYFVFDSIDYDTGLAKFIFKGTQDGITAQHCIYINLADMTCRYTIEQSGSSGGSSGGVKCKTFTSTTDLMQFIAEAGVSGVQDGLGNACNIYALRVSFAFLSCTLRNEEATRDRYMVSFADVSCWGSDTTTMLIFKGGDLKDGQYTGNLIYDRSAGEISASGTIHLIDTYYGIEGITTTGNIILYYTDLIAE